MAYPYLVFLPDGQIIEALAGIGPEHRIPNAIAYRTEPLVSTNVPRWHTWTAVTGWVALTEDEVPKEYRLTALLHSA